jgi:hypothetical protein
MLLPSFVRTNPNGVIVVGSAASLSSLNRAKFECAIHSTKDETELALRRLTRACSDSEQ